MEGKDLDDLFSKIDGKQGSKPRLNDVVGKRMRPIIPSGFD